MAVDLIAALRKQRRQWVELVDGQPEKAISFQRPPEADFYKLKDGIGPDLVCQYVDGWRGLTEADIVGGEHGSDAPAVFSPELFRVWVQDRADLLLRLAGAMAAAVDKHLSAALTIQGN